MLNDEGKIQIIIMMGWGGCLFTVRWLARRGARWLAPGTSRQPVSQQCHSGCGEELGKDLSPTWSSRLYSFPCLFFFFFLFPFSHDVLWWKCNSILRFRNIPHCSWQRNSRVFVYFFFFFLATFAWSVRSLMYFRFREDYVKINTNAHLGWAGLRLS